VALINGFLAILDEAPLIVPTGGERFNGGQQPNLFVVIDVSQSRNNPTSCQGHTRYGCVVKGTTPKACCRISARLVKVVVSFPSAGNLVAIG
jgi:hypothetical protein